MFILAIIVGFLGYYLIISMDYFYMVNVRIRMQQSILNAFSKISMEMSKSDDSSVTLASDNTGAYFLSPINDDGSYEFDSSGNILWQKWVCYYTRDDDDGKKKLIARKEEDIDPPSAHPGACPYADVASFAAANLHERIIAREVKTTSITAASYSAGYKIKVVIDGSDTRAKINEIEGITEVKVLN